MSRSKPNASQDPNKIEEQGDLALEEAKPNVDEPGRFGVYLLNDNYSTFEFVVEVLQKFFKKSLDEASQITLHVHHHGRGLGGVYSFEIAETKSVQVNEYAQSKGFPLKSVVEPLS